MQHDERLEALWSEKQAMYDLKLSINAGRRTCTEGTRKQLPSDLVKWIHDKNAPALYWMNGVIDDGKTMTAYLFSERLERHHLLADSLFCTQKLALCKSGAWIIPTSWRDSWVVSKLYFTTF
jgi:hypothetical protein